MGSVPRQILLAVLIGLALVALAGFVLGFSSTLKRGAADDEAAVPVSGLAISGAVQDATPLAEPPPPAPKAKSAAASDASPASDTPPAPAINPPKLVIPPLPSAPAEAAPGAPPTPPPAAPRPPPTDLPPT